VARDGFASIEATVAHAEALASQGRFAEAERQYRELVGQTHVIDYEYDDWLRRLAEIYRFLQRKREAGLVYLYLHYHDLARDAFPAEGAALERAQVLEIEKRWAEAAALYAQARRPVHAAVALERAKDARGAAATWATLAGAPELRDRPYEAALVAFNHGMALERVGESPPAARRALIESQRRLEQVADDFEARGERERAFDCYQILLKLGRDSGQFENLAEGYVNCIRVLKEDNLKFYVLQYYEDFVKLALHRAELHAAATLYQEAADYATRAGLPYDRHYQIKAAETWARCAEKDAIDGAPVELSEHALLAATACWSSVGDFAEVRRTFERLADLDLPEKKRRRYGEIAGRYLDARHADDEAPEFPDYLRQQHAYADIWFVDLIEWELAGDPGRVALSIVGDLRYPDGIRRRALVVLLTLADAATRDEAQAPETLAKVAELLGELQSYAALAPLEALYAHADPRVRRSAIRALRFLFFKRSFSLLRKGLADPEPSVREAALDAVRGLHFPHAMSPLSRIFREADDERVKGAALESIGRIQSVEAGEFLLMALRQEQGGLREVARRALSSLDNPDMVPILRAHQQIEGDGPIREVLDELVRAART
jgi:hypothetical protein